MTSSCLTVQITHTACTCDWPNTNTHHAIRNFWMTSSRFIKAQPPTLLYRHFDWSNTNTYHGLRNPFLYPYLNTNTDSESCGIRKTANSTPKSQSATTRYDSGSLAYSFTFFRIFDPCKNLHMNQYHGRWWFWILGDATASHGKAKCTLC